MQQEIAINSMQNCDEGTPIVAKTKELWKYVKETVES